MHVQHVQPHRAGFDLPSLLAVRRRKPLLPDHTQKFISRRKFLSVIFAFHERCMRGHDFCQQTGSSCERWRNMATAYKYETGHHRAHRARDIRLRRDGMTDRRIFYVRTSTWPNAAVIVTAEARTDGPSDLRPVSPSGPICARRPWDQWCGKGESLACGKTTLGR